MQITYKVLLMSTLLVAPALSSAPEPFITSFKRKLGNVLTYFITSSDVSDETTAYVEDLAKKVAPGQKITAVRKFNTFGECLFGKHNTIAFPFLNYLVLNARTLKKLPEEAQRFVVGRSLIQMTNKEHLLYKYLLPYLCHIYFQATESPDEKARMARLTGHGLMTQLSQIVVSPTVNGTWTGGTNKMREIMDQGRISLTNIGLRCAAQFLCAYMSRIVEQDADILTAQKLNCALGGIKFLKRYRSFSANSSSSTDAGSGLESICSKIPLFESANCAAVFAAKKMIPRFEEFDASFRPYDMTVARLHDHDFIAYAKSCTPGQITPYSNKLQHAIWNLPVLKYLSYFPATNDRIAVLSKMVQGGADQINSVDEEEKVPESEKK